MNRSWLPAVENTQTGEAWIRARITIYCPLYDNYHIYSYAQKHTIYIKNCPYSELPNALGTHHWHVPHINNCDHTNHSISVQLMDLMVTIQSIIPADPPSRNIPSLIDIISNIRNHIINPSMEEPDEAHIASWTHDNNGPITISRNGIM